MIGAGHKDGSLTWEGVDACETGPENLTCVSCQAWLLGYCNRATRKRAHLHPTLKRPLHCKYHITTHSHTIQAGKQN